jgi:hypothetical protein
MKKIYEFKKGDRIVRIQPAKSNGRSIFNPEGIGDRSYIGDELIFVGIANGQIYAKRTDKLSIRLFGDKLLNIPLDLFDEGWEYYINPEELLDESFLEDSIILSKEQLEEQLEKALEDENYELASVLKEKLDNDKRR